MNLQRDFLQYIIHLQKALNDFFTTSATKIFQILGLDDSFLDRDPQQWESEQSYSEAKIIIPALKVPNDLAEKRVALVQSFNEALVRNEEEKQFVLQMVEYHRNKFPKALKEIKKWQITDGSSFAFALYFMFKC